MYRRRVLHLVGLLVALLSTPAWAAESVERPTRGNRLTWLDEPLDPYYVGRDFPRLVTPQWVGEEGVEAVVVLAIDDMRDPAKYEAYLRPILDRLKQIDGRAPVSIMTCNVPPDHAQLQAWLREGVSLDVHTVDHPCPLLQGGDFAKAKSTYDRGVDLLAQVPGNRPVAFRMPCCDSLNTPSPRFWTEIFGRTSPGGRFLLADSSVFVLFTPADRDLPAALTRDEQGGERFRRYIPFPSFANTIENYPYPYVIGRTCWEFPCIVPSDWEAQHVQKPNNPDTVRDLQLALDGVVAKQGVFDLVFHPHGWIRNTQVVELIDHAVARHGPKVKFLTFRDAVERIERHLLDERSLRTATGDAADVRLLDVNDDGFQDVLYGDGDRLVTKVWLPATKSWRRFTAPNVLTNVRLESARFGVVDGLTTLLVRDGGVQLRQFSDDWQSVPFALADATPAVWRERLAAAATEVRLRDVDGDGNCELLASIVVGRDPESLVLRRVRGTWEPASFALPPGTALDPALRFADVDADGFDDLFYSSATHFSLHRFDAATKAGWKHRVLAGRRGDEPSLPAFVRPDGTNNGVWFHSRHVWVQNEDTNRLPNLVDRRAFATLLAPPAIASSAGPPAKPEPPKDPDRPAPLSPAESLATLHLRPGLKVELVAAEPLVVDPVAFDWGVDGRLWVVEMRDYPDGLDGRGKPGGRVKVLTDDDGDGRYDRATLFLDDVPFPTGVKVWRDGVLVTAAPDIFFAADRDGDGRAEHREVLFTGFVEGNQQHRVNGLRWGLDNWLYVGNGDSGGSIRSPQRPDQPPLNISGRDLRVRTDGRLEAQSGQTQFGRERDDWGNWFGGNNSNPIWHYVLDDFYLRRNPHVASPNVRATISEQPGAAPVFPRSRTLARFNDFDRTNRFTSACSPMFYRDEWLLPAFSPSGAPANAGLAFVCEPVHNLVHCEQIVPEGVTFRTRRLADEASSEFLASTDNWFRPAMIRTGPNGALWIADMYRFVIEHPKWIPADWQKKLDLRAGDDRGRIYRVVPAEGPARNVPRLDRLDTAGLVAALDSANGWTRDMVQQLLLERQDKAGAEPLRRVARTSPRATARLHALCTLDGLGALDADLLLAALHDEHAGVRRHAVRLAEESFASHPALADRVLALADDPDAFVRLQVAYCLGSVPVGAEPARAQLAARFVALSRVNRDSQTFHAALLSSLHARNFPAVLDAVLANGAELTPFAQQVVALVPALGSDEQLDAVVARLVADTKLRPALAPLLVRLAAVKPARAAEVSKRIGSDFVRQATDAKAAEADRVAAVRLLAASPHHADALAGLLSPKHPATVQVAAIESLAQAGDPRTPERLLAPWPSLTTPARNAVLDALLSRPAWSAALVEALATKRLAAGQFDARRRQQLTSHADAGVRKRAAEVLDVPPDAARDQVVAAYAKAVTTPGDIERGRLSFAKRCANCHRLNDTGHAVGPDLAPNAGKPVEWFLEQILDPNRAVESRYLELIAVTNDGRQFTGLLGSETTTSLVLLAAEGKQQTILRTDLEQLRTSGKSLMPEGVEKDMPPQEVADVIAFLKARRTVAAPNEK